MAVILCSIDDLAKYGKGKICRTSVGATRGMDRYEDLSFLAPTKELRNGHKYYGKSDEWYIAGYGTLMRERWAEVKAWLAGLKGDEDYTLLCYCAEGKFCHRKIIAAMIKKYRTDIVVELH